MKMKKYTIYLLFGSLFFSIFLSSCSQDDMYSCSKNENDEENIQPQLSEKRSLDEALSIVYDAINQRDSHSTRSDSKARKVKIFETKYITSDCTSKTRAANSIDTLMYAFNFENNEGFALVTADRHLEGLVALTECGNYSTEIESDVPAFGLYMNQVRDYIVNSEPIESVGNPPLDPVYEWKLEEDTTYYLYGPYVEMRWGQNAPYNSSVPSPTIQRAGCAPIAIAQVMSFFESPARMRMTFISLFTVENIDWDVIKTHVSSEYFPSNNLNYCYCSNSASHQAIAHIVRQIGKYCDIDYSNGGVGFSKIGTALDKLDYDFESCSMSGTTYNSNISAARAGIRNQKLTILCGLSDSDGHAWVMDGYRARTIHSYEYRREVNTTQWELYREYTSSTYYNHYNWGWNGACNGYFLDFELRNNYPYQLDNGSGLVVDDYNFEDQIGMYYNIEPE